MSDPIGMRPAITDDMGWIFEWSRHDYFVGRRFGLARSVDDYIERSKAATFRHWIITIDDEAVGQSLCYRPHFELGFAFVAVDILPAHRQKGLGRRAARHLVLDVFGCLPLHKLYAHHLVPTQTAETLGSLRDDFVLECVMPRHERVQGIDHDLCIWSVFASQGFTAG